MEFKIIVLQINQKIMKSKCSGGCGILDKSKFHKNNNTKDKLDYYCKDCKKFIRKIYYNKTLN